jgi:hypothetical protein
LAARGEKIAAALSRLVGQHWDAAREFDGVVAVVVASGPDAVLALGTEVLMLIALETGLIVQTGSMRTSRRATGERSPHSTASARRPWSYRTSLTSEAELRAFIADVTAFETEALAAMQSAATRTEIAWFRDLHEWTVLPHGVFRLLRSARDIEGGPRREVVSRRRNERVGERPDLIHATFRVRLHSSARKRCIRLAV